MEKSADNFRTIFNPLRKVLPYVRYIGAAKLPPGGKYRNIHAGFEICYVDSGHGEFQQGKKIRYKFKKGDILFIKPGKRFVIQADSEEVTSCFLGINLINPRKATRALNAEATQFSILEKICVQYHQKPLKDRMNIGLLLKKLVKEINEKRSGYLLLAKGYCLECLSLLARFIQDKGVGRDGNLSGRNYKIVEKTVKFIEGNYSKKLSLKDMAGNVFLSPYHFSRIFKACASYPPIRYLNMRRVAKAKELLADENLTFADIAGRVGFNDPFYFSAMFKRLEGMSPLQYKKLLR